MLKDCKILGDRRKELNFIYILLSSNQGPSNGNRKYHSNLVMMGRKPSTANNSPLKAHQTVGVRGISRYFPVSAVRNNPSPHLHWSYSLSLLLTPPRYSPNKIKLQHSLLIIRHDSLYTFFTSSQLLGH